MQASEIGGITPPFQKSAQLRIPPPPQLNTLPCPHSNTKVFRTVENEPLGDITRSDVKDVVANNNTKQLLTDRSGTETESGTTHNEVLYISTSYII